MNLFQVVDTFSGSKHVKFFASKEEAKKFRNEENEKTGKVRFLVGRGPAHWKGSTFPDRLKEVKK